MVKTAVPGMCGELVEMLITAETGGIESAEEVLKEDRFVDADQETFLKASREMYSVLASYTRCEIFDDREERDGFVWSGSMGEATRKP